MTNLLKPRYYNIRFKELKMEDAVCYNQGSMYSGYYPHKHYDMPRATCIIIPWYRGLFF